MALSRQRKAAFALAAIAIALLAGLFSLEAGLRLLVGTQATPGELAAKKAISYQASAFSRSVIEAREQEISGEGDSRYHINALGYRGREFAAAKKAGTTRVMVYGGSATFDINVSEDWPSRVERRLKSKGLAALEVINAGTPGHASSDAVGRLFAEGWRFSPDYVILESAWNDFKSFQSDAPLLRQVQPFDEVKSIDPRRRYLNPLDHVLADHSRLYLRLRYAYFQNYDARGREGGTVRGTGRISPAALEQYRLSFRLFADLCADIGARPILMTEPRLVGPNNTPDEMKKIRYDYVGMDQKLLLEAFAASDRIVREVALEKQALFLDASSRLSGHNELFSDHVHLTAAGSEALARLVADFLQAELEPARTEAAPETIPAPPSLEPGP